MLMKKLYPFKLEKGRNNPLKHSSKIMNKVTISLNEFLKTNQILTYGIEETIDSFMISTLNEITK